MKKTYLAYCCLIGIVNVFFSNVTFAGIKNCRIILSKGTSDEVFGAAVYAMGQKIAGEGRRASSGMFHAPQLAPASVHSYVHTNPKAHQSWYVQTYPLDSRSLGLSKQPDYAYEVGLNEAVFLELKDNESGFLMASKLPITARHFTGLAVKATHPLKNTRGLLLSVIAPEANVLSTSKTDQMHFNYVKQEIETLRQRGYRDFQVLLSIDAAARQNVWYEDLYFGSGKVELSDSFYKFPTDAEIERALGSDVQFRVVETPTQEFGKQIFRDVIVQEGTIHLVRTLEQLPDGSREKGTETYRLEW